MEKLKYILFGLTCGVLASGLILLISTPPRGVPIQLAIPPTPSPLMVDISGAVNAPGVYELALDARVQDAVELAGGLHSDADTSAVNMAARLMDGQKIIVPLEGEEISVTRSNSLEEIAGSASAADIQPLNINTATQEELETLPGIGPSKAAAIIDYRSTKGPFATLEDVLEVSGIGEKTLEGFKDLIIIQ
jgi:competence protein ComEA